MQIFSAGVYMIKISPYHLSVLAFVKFQFYFSPLNAKSYLTSSLDKKMFILMCKQALYKCVRYSYKRSLLELLTYPQFWQKRSFENWNIFASCHFVTYLTVLEQLSTSDWKDHFEQSSQLLFQVKLNKFNPSYNIRSHCLYVRSFQKARFPHLTSPGMSCILIQFIM